MRYFLLAAVLCIIIISRTLKYENKRTISFQRRYKRSFTRCVLHFIKITRNNLTRNKFKLIHTLNKVSHNVLKMKVDFLKVQ